MKKKIQIIIFIISCCIITSCSDNAVMNNNPVTPPENVFKYPYSVNSFWYYTTRNFITNIRPDSLHTYFSEDTLIGLGDAKFLNDTIINNDTLRPLRNEHSSAGHGHTTQEYYKQTDSGLIRVAYYTDGANFGPFRPVRNNLKYNVSGKTFNSLHDLSNSYSEFNLNDSNEIIFDNPPSRALKYPVIQNNEWNFITVGSTRITKKYTGYETVILTSGTFYCVKVKRSWYYDSSVPDPNSISYDYFSKEGMIKKDFLIKDVLITSSTGDSIGFIDVKEEDFLNLYFLP